MYNILKLTENNKGPGRKVGSGRTTKTIPKKQIKSLEKLIDKEDGDSQRSLAKRFNVSRQYISKIINKKTCIPYCKKTKALKRTAAQKAACRSKCQKLVALFRKKKDSESYFPLSNIAGYYIFDPNAMPNEIKLKEKANTIQNPTLWNCLFI